MCVQIFVCVCVCVCVCACVRKLVKVKLCWYVSIVSVFAAFTNERILGGDYTAPGLG
jgi:hypothetical protein